MTPTALDGRPSAQPPAPRREVFRPIQYMGAKVRMLGQIRDAVNAVDPAGGPVLDLFSGSGVVAADLGGDRVVTAVDVQEYARVLASALLSPARMSAAAVDRLGAAARATEAEHAGGGLGRLLAYEEEAGEALENGDPQPLCEIIEHGSIVAFQCGESGQSERLAEALAATAAELGGAGALTLTRHYGGVFFGYAQALRLDCLLAAVRQLSPGRERDTGLAAALGAASESVSSVGNHFAQPLRPRDKEGRPKAAALASAARRRRRDALSIFAERLGRYAELAGAATGSAAVRGDYRSFLSSHAEPVAAIYADPPYTRDHYSRFYHVLETIARGDDPSISSVTAGGATSLSRGLYRRDRHQSPFCIRSQAAAAFAELFAGARRHDAPLIVSYSPYSSGTAARPQPRLLTIPEVAELAAVEFSEVSLHSAGPLSHSKFNAHRLNGEAATEAELLLICLP
jgi:16S rRNA G966 N2-methylase RsmD